MRILSYACCGRQSHEKKKKTERLLITTLLSLSLSLVRPSLLCVMHCGSQGASAISSSLKRRVPPRAKRENSLVQLPDYNDCTS